MNKTVKIVLLSVAGTLLLCGLGAVTVFGLAWRHKADQAMAQKAAIEAEKHAFEARVDQLRREYQYAKEKEDALAEQLNGAKNETERQMIEVELRKAKRARQAAAMTFRNVQP